MKILIYSHFFAPSVGGVETVVSSLAHGLALRVKDEGREFEVTLVTSTPRGSFVDQALPFRVIRKPSAAYLLRLVSNADVVHVAGPAILPILTGIALRKPVVVEHHGFQAICPTGQLVQEPEIVPCQGHFMAGNHSHCLRCSMTPRLFASFRLWLLTFLRRSLCQRVTLNITPTTWLATELQLPRSEGVYHGIPFVPPPLNQVDTHQPPTLAFVGRIVTAKGVKLLLDAVATLKEIACPCKVVIIGDGPDRLAMEDYSRRTDVDAQVLFLGKLTEEQVSETLNRADILVAPSLGGEVFGMVIVENMLRGLPVVASNLGAYREVLGDAGVTFRVGDSRDLARQLSRLINNIATARTLGQAGRDRALKIFSVQEMIDRHEAIYRRIAVTK